MLHDSLTTGGRGTARPAIVSASLVAVFAPLVLLAFNRDWLITPEGFRDPWHYVGFFHNYWNPDFGPGAYKLGRLPWILRGCSPGAFCRRCPPRTRFTWPISAR